MNNLQCRCYKSNAKYLLLLYRKCLQIDVFKQNSLLNVLNLNVYSRRYF